jgi:hypothetical protein
MFVKSDLKATLSLVFSALAFRAVGVASRLFEGRIAESDTSRLSCLSDAEYIASELRAEGAMMLAVFAGTLVRSLHVYADDGDFVRLC